MPAQYPLRAGSRPSGLRPRLPAPPVRSVLVRPVGQVHVLTVNGQRSTVNRLPRLQLIVLFNENLFEILSTWPTLPPYWPRCLLRLGCTQSIVFFQVRAQRGLKSCQI